MTDIVERLRAYTDIKEMSRQREEAAVEIERLRAALQSLTEDPPSTLDEPDEDWEVIIKMREIAREALAEPEQPANTTVKKSGKSKSEGGSSL